MSQILVPDGIESMPFSAANQLRLKFETALAKLLADTSNKSLYPNKPEWKIEEWEAKKIFDVIEFLRKKCLQLLDVKQETQNIDWLAYKFLNKLWAWVPLVIHPWLVGWPGNYFGLLDQVTSPMKILYQFANEHNTEFDVSLFNQIQYMMNFVTQQWTPSIFYGTSVGGELQVRAAATLLDSSPELVNGVIVVGGAGILEQVWAGSGNTNGAFSMLWRPAATLNLVKNQFHDVAHVPPEVLIDIYDFVHDGNPRKWKVWRAFKIGRESTNQSLGVTFDTKTHYKKLASNPTLEAYKELYHHKVPICILQGKYDKIVPPLVPALILHHLDILDLWECTKYRKILSGFKTTRGMPPTGRKKYNCVFEEIEKIARERSGWLITVKYFNTGHTPDLELPTETTPVINAFARQCENTTI